MQSRVELYDKMVVDFALGTQFAAIMHNNRVKQHGVSC